MQVRTGFYSEIEVSQDGYFQSIGIAEFQILERDFTVEVSLEPSNFMSHIECENCAKGEICTRVFPLVEALLISGMR